MEQLVFKSNKARVAAGKRITEVRADGTLAVMVDNNPERYSEVELRVPPPIDLGTIDVGQEVDLMQPGKYAFDVLNTTDGAIRFNSGRPLRITVEVK